VTVGVRVIVGVKVRVAVLVAVAVALGEGVLVGLGVLVLVGDLVQVGDGKIVVVGTRLASTGLQPATITKIVPKNGRSNLFIISCLVQ
jgi:hypothetical protein